MMKDRIVLDEYDIQAIIADHYGVDLNDVSIRMISATVTKISKKGERTYDTGTVLLSDSR